MWSFIRSGRVTNTPSPPRMIFDSLYQNYTSLLHAFTEACTLVPYIISPNVHYGIILRYGTPAVSQAGFWGPSEQGPDLSWSALHSQNQALCLASCMHSDMNKYWMWRDALKLTLWVSRRWRKGSNLSPLGILIDYFLVSSQGTSHTLPGPLQV